MSSPKIENLDSEKFDQILIPPKNLDRFWNFFGSVGLHVSLWTYELEDPRADLRFQFRSILVLPCLTAYMFYLLLPCLAYPILLNYYMCLQHWKLETQKNLIY